MNIHNRIKDVERLRTNVCQDFLKMVIIPDWQQALYEKAETEVNNNGHLKNKYINVYEKMRDIGVKNYQINDMDVTIIVELFYGCKKLVHVDKVTLKALTDLRNDRNLSDHSGQNESEEELYLRSLIELCDLRNFVTTVDRMEKSIDDKKRWEYRQKYCHEIDKLKFIIDDERIILVQQGKQMDKDIAQILNGDKTWIEISRLYYEHYWKQEKSPHIYFEFVIKASDAGIIYAHKGAADYFSHIKDYPEMERRLFMIYNSCKKLSDDNVKCIIDTINDFLIRKNPLTDGMQLLIEDIKKQGYNIEQNKEGYYIWIK